MRVGHQITGATLASAKGASKVRVKAHVSRVTDSPSTMSNQCGLLFTTALLVILAFYSIFGNNSLPNICYYVLPKGGFQVNKLENMVLILLIPM